ncbi:MULTISPECIES: cytochrome c maturation protein CcmE domain-containing protein [Salibacter]|jgi:cytochrome c-type biogenesis protein CcmE|uniref:Cytochrome c maturation protein CcmE n=1 Tax=Salibacter halophilus TaxID=1803916 RepID=A0A6N6M9R8_9FLAO|nr:MULTISPECIES: cytochrome c maturation protein CcmE [Salibacter]KAB1065962.1 cytochrome c maturation protein CcmE [Salibacter halophilus]MDR9488442.1 cytochrome c maturation protein CcmE [Salibacter sp.]
MKKAHILGIIIIAIAIGAILTTLSDSSTYVAFDEAFSNPGEEYHVVGKLNKEKDLNYDPQTDPNKFTFHMIDNEGKEKEVVLHKSKPQDFERSEQIVLIGKAQGDEFHAKEVLMKCPSKYNDGTEGFKTEEEMEQIRAEEESSKASI